MIRIDHIRLLDPAAGLDQVQTVWLEDGHITDAPADGVAHEVIDGQGKWLMPALVDLCARLREPGEQQHGTLKSEGHAARAGGFLHVLVPPDTRPVLESGALLPGLRKKAMDDGGIHLHIIGALTRGLEGQQPANLAGLKQGGCIAVSNARQPFANDDVLFNTLQYAATLGLTVFFYPEEPSLAKDGCVHDGFMASRQGLTGIPDIAETVALAKQLLMIEQTGVHAHFSQLSCGASVELMRIAKARGLPVTADVAMHQLHLNDQCIDGFNALAHVRPPLRDETDRLKLRQGLADGVIDAICSHHQPLSATAKLAPFADTEAGISTFETFIALGVQLVNDGLIDALTLTRRMVSEPARIAGIESFRQATGGWIVVDPTVAWQVNSESLYSAGKNTPYLHQTLLGRVERLLQAD
ncbi:MAG: hypothetical protein RL180_1539 [Pseudomonadota bacterium]